jgi:hypothetical protein
MPYRAAEKASVHGRKPTFIDGNNPYQLLIGSMWFCERHC